MYGAVHARSPRSTGERLQATVASVQSSEEYVPRVGKHLSRCPEAALTRRASRHRRHTGSISRASLFLGALTRALTRHATIRTSGYEVNVSHASSGVPVSHAARSAFARMAGIRCLELWISPTRLFAGTVM